MTTSLSIIVPVYNVEQFLSDCIDSILNQTFQDFELILVDDGSKDKSGEICDLYEKKDSRIKVLHQANGGQMKATIAGISISNGKYLGFVDSDDLIFPDMYTYMMDSAMKTNSDIICIDGIRFHKNKVKPFANSVEPGTYPKDEIRSKIIPNMFMNHDLLGTKGIQPSKCLKIFKRELAENVYAKIPTDIQYGEDLLFSYTCIMESDRITILEKDKLGYKYRLNPGSISWVYRKDLFNRSMRVCSFLANNPEVRDNRIFQEELQYNICFYTINAFLNEYLMKNPNNGRTRKEHIKTIVESEMLQNAAWSISYKEISVMNKILMHLMQKKKIGAIHFIGQTIAFFRKPITMVSQMIF